VRHRFERASGTYVLLRHGKIECPTSEMGQHRTWRLRFVMSALTQQADIYRRLSQVRFGPIGDIRLLFNHLVGTLDSSSRRLGAFRYRSRRMGLLGWRRQALRSLISTLLIDVKNDAT
jgi:hypothetical protein